MMKKLAILILTLILGGLGYVGYQYYAAQQSDNVQIQKNCKYWKDKLGICKPKPINWKDVGDDIQDAFTPAKGGDIADGLSCIHNGACKSGLCVDGTCRNKKIEASVDSITINRGENGASCSKNSQCDSGVCTAGGLCKKNRKGEACIHDGYCGQNLLCVGAYKGNGGICGDKFSNDVYCNDDRDCKSGLCVDCHKCTAADQHTSKYGSVTGKCCEINDHIKNGRGHTKICLENPIAKVEIAVDEAIDNVEDATDTEVITTK